MNALSPIKIVVTFAVMVPLFLLCQAIGIPQGWTTTTVIAFVSFSVGSLAAALCNPSRSKRVIDRIKDGQTEDFLANLERGRVKVTQAAPR